MSSITNSAGSFFNRSLAQMAELRRLDLPPLPGR